MTVPNTHSALVLTPRLFALAQLVPPGARLADIGTDHALLPVHLAAAGRVAGAIAIDVRPGAVTQARRTVARWTVGDRVEVRCGDGLAALRPGEADVVVVSGLGGRTLHRLLAAHPAHLAGVGRLVLGPQSAVPEVRRWLVDAGWALTAERLVHDDGVDYEILVAEPGEGRAAFDWPGRPRTLTFDVLLQLGPHLTRAADPPWQACWRRRAARWEAVALALRRMTSPSANARADGLVERAQNVRAAVEAAAAAAGTTGARAEG